MSEAEEALIEAAMSGDLVKVRQLVGDGVDVNSANRMGMTPLMVAAQWNRLKIVSFLLSRGGDVEAREHSSGCNALFFACLSCNPAVVRMVLKHGAHVNSTNHDGRSALMTASFCGMTGVVKTLLKHGADVDAMDRFGATALTHALMAGQREVVKLLVVEGADAKRQAKKGRSP